MNLEDALDSGAAKSNVAGGAEWPGGPAWPGQPTNPAWPGQPAQPTWPGQQPGQPAWPGQQPGQPAWPGQQPGQPAWPGQQPGQPAWPGQQPGMPAQPGWPGQPNQPSAPGWPTPAPQTGPQTAPALTVPYGLPLRSGVYDKMLITILGEVNPDANAFAIDLKRNNDIAFHFNVRFNEHGKQVIVRNSMIGNQWGTEERAAPSFPFVKGKPFELKILCTSTDFKVAVNKSHLLEFKHRVRELNQIQNMSIYKDIKLSYVNVENLP